MCDWSNVTQTKDLYMSYFFYQILVTTVLRKSYTKCRYCGVDTACGTATTTTTITATATTTTTTTATATNIGGTAATDQTIVTWKQLKFRVLGLMEVFS